MHQANSNKRTGPRRVALTHLPSDGAHVVSAVSTASTMLDSDGSSASDPQPLAQAATLSLVQPTVLSESSTAPVAPSAALPTNVQLSSMPLPAHLPLVGRARKQLQFNDVTGPTSDSVSDTTLAAGITATSDPVHAVPVSARDTAPARAASSSPNRSREWPKNAEPLIAFATVYAACVSALKLPRDATLAGELSFLGKCFQDGFAWFHPQQVHVDRSDDRLIICFRACLAFTIVSPSAECSGQAGRDTSVLVGWCKPNLNSSLGQLHKQVLHEHSGCGSVCRTRRGSVAACIDVIRYLVAGTACTKH